MRGASYKKGEIIFREGDPGNCMYDIFWGRVGVYTGYGTPQEKKLAELKIEDFFGEMGLISSASAVVEEDHTTLEAISKDDLVVLAKSNPLKLDMIMGHLANRLRRLTVDYVKACEEAAKDL